MHYFCSGGRGGGGQGGRGGRRRGRISPLIASYSYHAFLLLNLLLAKTQKYLEVSTSAMELVSSTLVYTCVYPQVYIPLEYT